MRVSRKVLLKNMITIPILAVIGAIMGNSKVGYG